MVDGRYADPCLSLVRLAKELNVSIWHLGRLFKESTGMGFRRYLRSVRMFRAKELLSTTFLSIKEVAIQVGYKHMSDFDHHFKHDHGRRPTEHRNLHPPPVRR
jgi:transcriptional regulator GlxA family with amidase domain